MEGDVLTIHVMAPCSVSVSIFGIDKSEITQVSEEIWWSGIVFPCTREASEALLEEQGVGLVHAIIWKDVLLFWCPQPIASAAPGSCSRSVPHDYIRTRTSLTTKAPPASSSKS